MPTIPNAIAHGAEGRGTIMGLPAATHKTARSAPVVPVVPVAPGDVVAGKYEILEPLGAGGMGFVFAAKHLTLGQKLAIKFLAADPGDTKATERFAREANIAAELKSEQVAHVMDLGALPDGTSYIVMELLEGMDFEALITERTRVPASEAVDYILQACVAVAEAHSRGVVHRDIKPGNLFLTARADGSPLVKVLDFGISKRLEGADVRLTQTGSAFGSPLYMSPEQLRDVKTVDGRADIWALAIVLYELIAGTAAFESETLHETVARIAADPHLPLRDVVPKIADLPEELDDVLAQCLAKQRDDRPADIAELARALAPFGSPGVVATYLPRVIGSAERPSSPSSPSSDSKLRASGSVAASRPTSTRRINSPANMARTLPEGSSTERAWNTPMRPPPPPAAAPVRGRRTLILAAAALLVAGAAVAVVARRSTPGAPQAASRPEAAPGTAPAGPPPETPDLPPATAIVAPPPLRPEAHAAGGHEDAGAHRPSRGSAPVPAAAQAPSPAARPRSPGIPGVNDDPFKKR